MKLLQNQKKLKIVDKYKTEENLNSHFEYEIIPKKIESHLTNFITYDVENIILIERDLIVSHFFG